MKKAGAIRPVICSVYFCGRQFVAVDCCRAATVFLFLRRNRIYDYTPVQVWTSLFRLHRFYWEDFKPGWPAMRDYISSGRANFHYSAFVGGF
jgi:hypothetical protein